MLNGFSGTAEGVVGFSDPGGKLLKHMIKIRSHALPLNPVHGNETCCGIFCVLGCLSPLTWAVVRFIVLPFHLWFPCLLTIFNTIKWVKNESITHTIMLWVAWREVCIAVQTWLCCGRWGKNQSSERCAKYSSVQTATFTVKPLHRDIAQYFFVIDVMVIWSAY